MPSQVGQPHLGCVRAKQAVWSPWTGHAASMSSRRVKQQLAALQQRQKTSSDLHHTLSASKKKRLRPRDKRKRAQKDLKLVTDAKHTQQTVQKNLKYYQATTHSKATAQAAAVMSEVTHRVAPMVKFVLHSGAGVSIACFLCSC